MALSILSTGTTKQLVIHGDSTQEPLGKTGVHSRWWRSREQFWTPTSMFVHGRGDVNSWNYSTRYYLTSQFEIDELVSQEKALLVRYCRPCAYRGKALNLFFTHLTKRFVETSREVRTWRCQIVGKSEGNEPFMRVDVVGWLVIQSVEKGIVTRVSAHYVPKALETSRSDLTREEIRIAFKSLHIMLLECSN